MEQAEKLFGDLYNRIYAEARRRFRDRAAAAKADMVALKATIETDSKRLIGRRLNNELTDSELKELLGDQLRLAQLAALTQAGLTLVELDKFRRMVIDIGLKFAFDRLLPI